MKKHFLLLLCSLLVAWNLHAQTSVGYQDNWPKPNGLVYAIAHNGNTVYIGGDFNSVGGQTRNRIAAIDATTGTLTSWNPDANGNVLALAVSGNTVYAGGYFSSIGGQSRIGLAALDTSTGTATSWNPGSNGGVYALAVNGSTVYAGGYFNSIGGQGRSYIAALDAGTGNATSWNPGANDEVYALAVSGSTVYAGGFFNSIGGQGRSYIAALDAGTGNATSWNPGANNAVFALAVNGSTAYAGGWFNSIGGQTRNQIAALDAGTGNATSWNPGVNGAVYALAASGNTVYAGGYFNSIGGQGRNQIAALDAGTGNATSWNPGANGAVLALAVNGSTVYAGGYFTSMGGDGTRQYFMPLVDSNNLPSATVSIAASAMSVCAGTSVTFTATPTNASSPTYQWTKNSTAIAGETNATYTSNALSNGDSVRCQMTSSGVMATSNAVGMTINPLPATPNISAVRTATTICAGDFVNLASDGDPDKNYLWSNGVTGQINSAITVAGSYTVTVTDTNGCSATSAPTVVTVNPLPAATVTAGGATTFCAGGSVVLNAPVGMATYQWSNGDNTRASTISTTGSYTVTVTDSNGCSNTSSATNITVNPLPSTPISAFGPTTVCFGNCVLLSPQLAQYSNSFYYTYSWSNGGTNVSTSVCQTGNYTLTVTDTNNCSATSAPIAITVNSLPSVSVTAAGATTFCAGSSVALSASTGMTSYQWSNGDNTQASTVSTSGNYSVTVTDSNGCSNTSSATAVTVNPAVTPAVSIAASANPITPGTSVTFTATATDGGSAPQYQWTKNGTVVGTNSDAFSTSSLNNGDSIVCTLTSNAACATSTTARSNAITMSFAYCTASVQEEDVAFIQNVTVAGISNWSSYITNGYENFTGITGTMASGGIYPFGARVNSYYFTGISSIRVWIDFNQDYDFNDPGEQVIASNVTASIFNGTISVPSNALTGTTRMRVFYNLFAAPTPCSNAYYGNIEDYTISITPPCPAQSVSATASTLTPCVGSPVTFTATPTNGGTTPAYQWRVNGTDVSGETAATFTTSFSANSQVSVVMTPTTPCPSTPTVESAALNVMVNALPDASLEPTLGSTTFCSGSWVDFLASNRNYNNYYRWYRDGNAIAGAVGFSYQATVAGTYTLVVTNNSGCSATSVARTVTVNPLPDATVTAGGPTTFCSGGNVVLSAPAGAASYQWYLNGNVISGAMQSDYTANASGDYTVRVTNNGCQVTSAATGVTVSDCTPVITSTTLSGPICQRGTFAVNFTANRTFGAGNVFSLQLSNASGSFANPTTIGTLNGTTSGTINASLGAAAAGTGYRVRIVSSSPALTSADNGSDIVILRAPSSTQVAVSPATPVVCAGSSITLSVPATAGFSYQWQTGGADIAGATANTFTASPAATTSYRCVVTAANGCASSSAAKSVTVKTPPVFTTAAGSSTSICQGGSVTLSLNATTATAAYSNYQWTKAGMNISGATNSSYTATDSGSYALTISDSTGCGRTSPARVVTVNPAPVASVTASGPTTFCAGGSVTLSAVSYPSQTYKWFLNGAAYSTILSRTITTSGTYQLQARLGNCFATSAAIPVTVNPLPAAAIITSGPNAICSGSSVLLEATPNNASNTYVWTRGAAVLPSTTAQHNANATGNYRVTVTDTNGCTRTSSLYALTVATTPTATITALGSTTIGATGSVTLQANSGTGFTYQWFRRPLPNQPLLPINGATNQSYTATLGGSYTVLVINGCAMMSNPITIIKTASKEALGITSNNVLEEAFSFSAFPNPADNSVTVRTNGAVSQSATVQVMSLTGAAVKEVEMKEGQTEIDLSGMASGIYLLRYKDAEGRTGIIRLQKQ